MTPRCVRKQFVLFSVRRKCHHKVAAGPPELAECTRESECYRIAKWFHLNQESWQVSEVPFPMPMPSRSWRPDIVVVCSFPLNWRACMRQSLHWSTGRRSLTLNLVFSFAFTKGTHGIYVISLFWCLSAAIVATFFSLFSFLRCKDFNFRNEHETNGVNNETKVPLTCSIPLTTLKPRRKHDKYVDTPMNQLTNDSN